MAQPGLSFPGPAEEDIGKVKWLTEGGGALTVQGPKTSVSPHHWETHSKLAKHARNVVAVGLERLC